MPPPSPPPDPQALASVLDKDLGRVHFMLSLEERELQVRARVQAAGLGPVGEGLTVLGEGLTV